MANVEQFQNEAPLVTQRTGLLATSSNALARVREAIDQPGFRRAFPTLLATLTAVAAIVLYLGMQKSEMTTLYSSLSESEKSQVLNSLKNMGVDVQLNPATGEILVPANEYHQSRIALAAQGLPEFSGDDGNNLDNLPLGISRSVEGVRLRQVQEVELAKSITEISSVKAARVHLALPEKSVFVRDQTPPTASVFLNLKNGRVLDKTQVLAITNLVSSSIPGMNPNNVSIVDQFGNLLSNAPDDPDQILADNQLEYRMRLESIYRNRIQSLVTPIVGSNNVNAQVNIEIDFTRRELSQEIVDPDASATLSEQSSLNVTAKKEAMGIPGAISNEPPEEATVNQQENQAGAAINQANNKENQKFETKSSTELKNYENSKTFETVKNPSNVITRIDAALLIRDKKVVDPETNEISYQPVAQEVIQELENLVKSALGIKLERGDTLTITSQPFVDEFDGFEEKLYDTTWFRSTVENSLLVLLIGVVALGVVRPMLNKILVPTASTNSVMELYAEAETMADIAAKRATETAAVEVDEGESLDEIKAKLKPKKKGGISADLLDTANTYDDKVALVRMIVTDEAGRVANVFKQMMRDDLELLK
ncbi:MAG: flagellar M-ring protein FliF [Rhodobiaceae bacterium]|nr:flagellar M-ring protein FliF [Rhodobiaceae bacterium]|tara:strand:- start:11753 stop:13540 length:1788 start_codon:yes stop_codon:yes gene_type:complete